MCFQTHHLSKLRFPHWNPPLRIYDALSSTVKMGDDNSVVRHRKFHHAGASREGTRETECWPLLRSQKWSKELSLIESDLEFSNPIEQHLLAAMLPHAAHFPTSSRLAECICSRELAVRKMPCMKRSLLYTLPYYVIKTQAQNRLKYIYLLMKIARFLKSNVLIFSSCLPCRVDLAVPS